LAVAVALGVLLLLDFNVLGRWPLSRSLFGKP